MTNAQVQLVKEKVRQLERVLAREILNETVCCGVSLSQRHVLLEVWRGKEISLVDLAAILGLDTSTLSRTVNSLVNLGLVSRIPNPKDRRYILISLTEQGRAACDLIERSSDHFYRRVLRSLPKDREHQIIDSLAMLVDEFKKFRESPSCGGREKGKTLRRGH